MAFALRRQAKRPVRELVSEDYSLSLEQSRSGGGKIRIAVLVLAVLGAAGVAAGTVASRSARPAEGFFSAGALMLIGGIAALRILLARLSSGSARKLTIGGLGVRNAARPPGRSLAAAGMLASGCFIVFSVSVMKEDLSTQAGERRSGTGGVRLYGESSIAVP